MKKIGIIICFLIFCGIAKSQGIYTPIMPTIYGQNFLRIKPMEVLHIPAFNDTLSHTLDTSAQIRLINGVPMFHYGSSWKFFAPHAGDSAYYAGYGIKIISNYIIADTNVLVNMRHFYSTIDSLGRLKLNIGDTSVFARKATTITINGDTHNLSNNIVFNIDTSHFIRDNDTLTYTNGLIKSGKTVSALNLNAMWNAFQLRGVPISSTLPTNGQSLVYNSSADRWEPQAITGGGTGGDNNYVNSFVANQNTLTISRQGLSDLPVHLDTTYFEKKDAAKKSIDSLAALINKDIYTGTTAQIKALTGANYKLYISTDTTGLWVVDYSHAGEAESGVLKYTNTDVPLARVFDNEINIEWFGGKGDYNGTTGTDNSIAFNKAVHYLTTADLIKNATIKFPTGNYKFLSQVATYPNILLKGENQTTFFFDRMLPDTADGIVIKEPFLSANTGRRKKVMENISIVGNQSYGSFSYRNSSAIRIETPYLDFNNCTYHGFEHPENYADNSYLIAHYSCNFSFNNYGIYFNGHRAYNSEENENYTDCLIANNNYGIYNIHGGINLIGGSVDYSNIQQIAENKTDTGGVTNNRTTAIATHFESSPSAKYNFVNNGVMQLTNCIFENLAIGDTSRLFLNNGDLSLINPTFILYTAVDNYIVDGIAPIVIGQSYETSSTVNLIHPGLSQVYNSQFEDGVNGWNVIFGSGISSTSSHKGSGAIKVFGNGTFNAGQVESNQIPINKGYSRIYPSAFVNTYHAGGFSSFQIVFYDQFNNQLEVDDIPTAMNGTDSYLYRSYGWIDIPKGSTTYVIKLLSGSPSITDYVLYDDVYVTYK